MNKGGVVPTHQVGCWRLRLDLKQTRQLLLQRIEKLEADTKPVGEPKPLIGRFFAWMGPALPTLIVSVAVLVLGYGIKDSVDLAIRQQQLQLSYVKEMQPLLEKLGSTGEGEIGAAGKEQIAILIAGFGEPAVMPLANELRYNGNRLQSGKSGLRTLALTHREAVCRLMSPVLERTPPWLGWQGHQAVVSTLAAAECVDAMLLLEDHSRAIRRYREGDKAAISTMVNDQPNIADIKTWLDSIDSSLTALSTIKQK